MSLRIDIGHRIGELNLSVAFSVESGLLRFLDLRDQEKQQF